MTKHYFLEMIRNLLEKEEILLYGNILEVSDSEIEAAGDYLESVYTSEQMEYPAKSPSFNPAAAVWAAKTVYLSAQLILYRENKGRDLALLLPDYEGAKTAETALSADLCLRFLPGMIYQLKLIDTQDELIELLEQRLQQWHYSGINYPLETTNMDFSWIHDNACLKQLYVNRIIEYKKIKLAEHVEFLEMVKANLGIHTTVWWNEIKELKIGNDK